MRGPTRRELLLTAAGAAAAGAIGEAIAGVAAPAARASTSSAKAPLSVPDQLQELITVEMLLLYCYQHVLASSILSPRARRTVAPFVAHEQAHIHALERELTARGGHIPSPPASPTAANHALAQRKVGGRLGQLRGDLDAIRLLLTTEQVTIGVYSAALTTIGQPTLIELLCQMMANDAQHDAMLGLLLPPGKIASAVPYGLVQGLQ
ncbi:MAG TPA: ferritin-like domain-containing protein [Solirubrobacteraceae bacterium]|nr:ferritin-like domain-containing protein [Solirubrobacteraceae bacterium]